MGDEVLPGPLFVRMEGRIENSFKVGCEAEVEEGWEHHASRITSRGKEL
jgi:hypothetical protein